MRNILIFGNAQQACQLRRYIEDEQYGNIAAFVLESSYKEKKWPDLTEQDGLPVLTLEQAVRQFPPETHEMAVSLAYGNMVRDRQRACEAAEEAGYALTTFVSSHAHVFAKSVGPGTIIYPGCTVGHNVVLGKGNFLEIGVSIAHDTTVGDYNFFAPSATICGDVQIGCHNFIGSHATVISWGKLDYDVLVAAGALVRETESNGVYFPARTVKWHGVSSDIQI